MTFTKKRLKTEPKKAATGFTNVRESYFASKRKNFFVSVFFGILATVFIGLIGIGLLSRFSGFHLGFEIPSFITSNIPFLAQPNEPEKFNILLTGVGGVGHDGTDLTDTIILASVNRKTHTISMLSIPRDLYIEFPIKGRGKINETYQRGLRNSTPDEAMKGLASKVTEITGEPIDAYFNIDFAGFTKFIDILGGVEVDVPEDLLDREYPDDNWGYMTLRVKKGLQTFDGQTALKYVRSRHSTSDFDRSHRQQLVLAAIKNKLLTFDALTSPSKLQSLYYAITSHIKTDLAFNELVSLALFAKDLPSNHILAYNLNDMCFQSASLCNAGSFLYTPNRELFGGSSVLLPDGATPTNISTYKDISLFTHLIFDLPQTFVDRDEITIVNTTKIPGIATRLALRLKRFGFNIPEKNSIVSTKDTYPKSMIYHVWDPVGKTGVSPDSATLTALSMFVYVPTEAGSDVKYSKLAGPGIEVILGQDASTLLK